MVFIIVIYPDEPLSNTPESSGPVVQRFLDRSSCIMLHLVDPFVKEQLSFFGRICLIGKFFVDGIPRTFFHPATVFEPQEKHRKMVMQPRNIGISHGYLIAKLVSITTSSLWFMILPTVVTLWLFNIAIENGPFIDDFPIKTTIYSGFSMAMSNNEMVMDVNGGYKPTNITLGAKFPRDSQGWPSFPGAGPAPPIGC